MPPASPPLCTPLEVTHLPSEKGTAATEGHVPSYTKQTIGILIVCYISSESMYIPSSVVTEGHVPSYTKQTIDILNSVTFHLNPCLYLPQESPPLSHILVW